MASIERKNIKPALCWREKSGLHCRCKYRKLPNTCPFLHENESMQQYKGRIMNNPKYGVFETAEKQWERWRKFGEPTFDYEEDSDEPDGEFYAYSRL